jgi:hypothetical protein
VSAAPGRPAELQTTTAADALVRLDQLGQVRLTLPSGSSGGLGSAAALFTIGERRLVRVGLDPPVAGGGSGGPPGATLTAGTVVRVAPVPPGAPAPAIDPFLRRTPP